MSYTPQTPSRFNHAARRAYVPPNTGPQPAFQRKITENPTRKVYWCHLCFSSRLDDHGLDHRYDQAHPTRLRYASSRMYTTYSESRHGRQHQSPTQGFLTLRYGGSNSRRDRPTVQLLPARSQHGGGSAADLIPRLLQPPPSQYTVSGYHTIRSLACAPVGRAVKSAAPLTALGLPPRRRRRLSSPHSEHSRGGVMGQRDQRYPYNETCEEGEEDEDADDDGDIRHYGSPGPEEQTANAAEKELNTKATRALEARAAYEEEAQDRS